MTRLCNERQKSDLDKFYAIFITITRTEKASFKNSVVFPGGVNERADASPDWLQLLKSFGYSQGDFDALHCVGTPVSPLFSENPVQRHIALRITAIRETFEELGVLICSRAHKKDKGNLWANTITNIDTKQWQSRISKNPEELLALCKQLDCYPDIWSLHYWSSWLSPASLPKRFATAFFVTALESKPVVETSTEVAKAEWLTTTEILDGNREGSVLLYPPQSYELNKLACWTDIEELAEFSRDRSSIGSDLYYHATVQASDGKLFVFPGDDLYPSTVDFNKHTTIEANNTVAQLRESCKTINRLEFRDSKYFIVLKNFKPNNMDIGDKDIQVYLTF